MKDSDLFEWKEDDGKIIKRGVAHQIRKDKIYFTLSIDLKESLRLEAILRGKSLPQHCREILEDRKQMYKRKNSVRHKQKNE